MNKIKIFLPVLLMMLLVSTACNNSNTGSNMTTPTDTVGTVDTALKSDTINVDPENFSDPH